MPVWATPVRGLRGRPVSAQQRQADEEVDGGLCPGYPHLLLDPSIPLFGAGEPCTQSKRRMAVQFTRPLWL